MEAVREFFGSEHAFGSLTITVKQLPQTGCSLQGGRQDGEGPRRAADPLRLSGRALETYPDLKSDQEHL